MLRVPIFANGAQTAAIQYTFNQISDELSKPPRQREIENLTIEGHSVDVVDGTNGGGLSAKSPINGVKLNRELASKQQLDETGVPIAGSGSSVPLHDVNRLTTQYGGQTSDWSKMSSSQHISPDGRKFEIEALMELLQQQFGVRPNDIHQQIPEGVSITLAHGQPLGVEFDQDRILVTIKLAELRTPRKRWRNFTVRARYKADVGRTHVRLERDGSLELISKKLGFRDQIALRGIFIKVLSANHQFQVIQGRIKEDPRLANLRITQFVAREGWIGISLGNPESLKQAMVPPTVRQAAKQSTTDSVR